MTTFVCQQLKLLDKQGYYGTTVSPIACPHPCKTCSVDGLQCLSCLVNFYMSSTGVCSRCDEKCDTCLGSASTCTSCHMGYLLDSGAGTCTAVCERYEYLDTVSGECMLCPYPCNTCDQSDPFKCLTCYDGFYYVPATQQCLPCNDKCRTCNGPAVSQCLSCFKSFSLVG